MVDFTAATTASEPAGALFRKFSTIVRTFWLCVSYCVPAAAAKSASVDVMMPYRSRLYVWIFSAMGPTRLTCNASAVCGSLDGSAFSACSCASANDDRAVRRFSSTSFCHPSKVLLARTNIASRLAFCVDASCSGDNRFIDVLLRIAATLARQLDEQVCAAKW